MPKVLADIIKGLLEEGYSPDEIAIVLISYDEDGRAFLVASSKYDILSKVRWFGTDGTAKADKIIKDPISRSFAVKVGGLVSTLFAPIRTNISDRVGKYVEEVTGMPPFSYVYTQYDIIWLLAYSLLAVGEYDVDKIREVLPKIAMRMGTIIKYCKTN